MGNSGAEREVLCRRSSNPHEPHPAGVGGKEGGEGAVHGCQFGVQPCEQVAPGQTHGGTRNRAGPHQMDWQLHSRPPGKTHPRRQDGPGESSGYRHPAGVTGRRHSLDRLHASMIKQNKAGVTGGTDPLRYIPVRDLHRGGKRGARHQRTILCGRHWVVGRWGGRRRSGGQAVRGGSGVHQMGSEQRSGLRHGKLRRQSPAGKRRLPRQR